MRWVARWAGKGVSCYVVVLMMGAHLNELSAGDTCAYQHAEAGALPAISLPVALLTLARCSMADHACCSLPVVCYPAGCRRSGSTSAPATARSFLMRLRRAPAGAAPRSPAAVAFRPAGRVAAAASLSIPQSPALHSKQPAPCIYALSSVQGSWIVKDLSTNGTFVNTTRIGRGKTAPVKPGDRVRSCCCLAGVWQVSATWILILHGSVLAAGLHMPQSCRPARLPARPFVLAAYS